MNKVSVIIPNYNRATIIGETIENMLSQTLKPHEIIVVDDGSSDNSVAVIKGFGNKVKLIQQSNQGPGVARNTGIKEATGDFIQLQDSDDLVSDNKLEVQANLLVEKNADIVYGPWLKAEIHEHTIRPIDVVLQTEALPDNKSTLLWFLTDWSLVLQQCLIRRSLINRSGGYRSDMWGFEDSEYFIRLLTFNPLIVHENKSLTLYRDNDFGKLTASGQNNKKRAQNHADLYKVILDLSKTSSILKPNLSHPKFQYRAWGVVNDLIACGVLDSENHKELVALAEKLPKTTILKYILQKKLESVKSRFTGHRWSRPFMAAPLNEYQKKLITDLGFNIVKL